MIWVSLYNTLNAHPRMLLMSLKWDDRSSFSWNLLIANFWAEKRDDRLVFTRFPKRFSLLTNMVVRCFSVADALLVLLMPIAYCLWESDKKKNCRVFSQRPIRWYILLRPWSCTRNEFQLKKNCIKWKL